MVSAFLMPFLYCLVCGRQGHQGSRGDEASRHRRRRRRWRPPYRGRSCATRAGAGYEASPCMSMHASGRGSASSGPPRAVGGCSHAIHLILLGQLPEQGRLLGGQLPVVGGRPGARLGGHRLAVRRRWAWALCDCPDDLKEGNARWIGGCSAPSCIISARDKCGGDGRSLADRWPLSASATSPACIALCGRCTGPPRSPVSRAPLPMLAQPARRSIPSIPALSGPCP